MSNSKNKAADKRTQLLADLKTSQHTIEMPIPLHKEWRDDLTKMGKALKRTSRETLLKMAWTYRVETLSLSFMPVDRKGKAGWDLYAGTPSKDYTDANGIKWSAYGGGTCGKLKFELYKAKLGSGKGTAFYLGRYTFGKQTVEFHDTKLTKVLDFCGDLHMVAVNMHDDNWDKRVAECEQAQKDFEALGIKTEKGSDPTAKPAKRAKVAKPRKRHATKDVTPAEYELMTVEDVVNLGKKAK